jgi:hypothetical protein
MSLYRLSNLAHAQTLSTPTVLNNCARLKPQEWAGCLIDGQRRYLCSVTMATGSKAPENHNARYRMLPRIQKFAACSGRERDFVLDFSKLCLNVCPSCPCNHKPRPDVESLTSASASPIHYSYPYLLYRVFQKEIYTFESIYTFIRRIFFKTLY